MFSFLFLSGLFLGNAQDEKDGKITVEITKEINGEKRTFKGEYENVDQMRADPNYQEFADEDEGFSFWFDRDGDEDVFLKLDQFDQFGKSFQFGFGGSGLQGFNMLKHFNLDSIHDQNFNFFHFDADDWDGHEESIERLQDQMQELLENLGEEGNSRVFLFGSKRIKVLEVEGDEFGKKGKVSESNLLELDDLSFYPNPSSDGRFKVRFRVPKEDELNIKVFNLEGKEVFNRYFERFGGLYSESLDLSGQKEGIYLLEISQGKDRLTRKIVITK